MAATLLTGLLSSAKARVAASKAAIVPDLVHLIAAGQGFAMAAKSPIIALQALLFAGGFTGLAPLGPDMEIWREALAAGLERHCVPVLRQLASDPSSGVYREARDLLATLNGTMPGTRPGEEAQLQQFEQRSGIQRPPAPQQPHFSDAAPPVPSTGVPPAAKLSKAAAYGGDGTVAVRCKSAAQRLQCAACGKAEGEAGVAKLKTCSGCHVAAYCSAACRNGHWKAHKAACRAAAASSAAAAAAPLQAATYTAPNHSQIALQQPVLRLAAVNRHGFQSCISHARSVCASPLIVLAAVSALFVLAVLLSI